LRPSRFAIFSRAAIAEHDRLLGIARDQDLLVDRHRSVLALLIFLGLDRARIRPFGVELEVDLLAGDFGDHRAIEPAAGRFHFDESRIGSADKLVPEGVVELSGS
jgi:hypothetical protein